MARNLLAADGVFVASLDDNEIHNFRKVCDEVFGEGNFLFQITTLCNPKGRSQDKFVANCHEYLVGYSRNALEKGRLNIPKLSDEIEENYKLRDSRGVYRELELRNTHREFGKHNRKNLWYPFHVDSEGRVFLDASPGREAIFPIWNDGFEGCWTWGQPKAAAQLDEIVGRKVKDKWKIFVKNYAFDEEGDATKQVKSIWTDRVFHTERGQAAFNELFESKGKIFQSPKSLDTLKQLLQMSTQQGGLVLDYFSGSGSLAHATMELNAQDGITRRWVLVQIPDATEPGSEAFECGFKTISEIGKERIRRAGQKVRSANVITAPSLDTGFRVLKIDSSNMNEVYYTPDLVSQDLLSAQVDNIREDRTAEDLLFQVLIDWGVDLTLPIAQEEIAGKTVFFVDDNALAACFETDINEAFVKLLAKRRPWRAVFRDTGFASDSVKINVEQIFKLMSPNTEVKTI